MRSWINSVVKNPQKAVESLSDDWRLWPLEAQLLYLEALRRRQDGPRVSSIFNLDLHPAQRQVITEARRFNVADCGRRWGKSLLGEYLVTETVLSGQPTSWMSPSYRSLSDSWRDLKRILQPITVEKSEQEHRIETNTGGVLDCWSLDNPDAPRGRKYKRVVIDEAAMVAYLGEAWQAVIEPTLMDLRGDAWFLSTPKGRNFFCTAFNWGQDSERYPEWKSWQMPTVANTTIPHLVEEVERKRLTIPERIFRQEYMAEFIDDAGGVFRGVAEAATIDATEGWPAYAANLVTTEEGVATFVARGVDSAHQYIIGIDWGKLNDFTVLAVIDMTTMELVALDRFNQIDYHVQIKRLKALASHFNTKSLVPERNSIGEPLIEQLQRDGYSVHAFTTTNASKTELIDALTLAFEKHELRILNLPVLLDELQAYEAERLPSGLLRYSAPEGYHDDCVMALALAWYGASRPTRVEEPEAYSYGYQEY
jgi:hypothetical protein